MSQTQLAKSATSRTKTVVEDLEGVLLAFMLKHRITHDEYRHVTDLLIDTIKAGEESLLFDVFFEAQATDIGNLGRDGSPEAIEGPFYLSGAPQLPFPYVLPQRQDEAGDVLFFHGRVTNADGKPLKGAELDIWQADAEGLYSNIHPDIPAWNLRGRIQSDAEGMFEVRTILPPPYEIPKEGPTGRVLNALGRHFFRPAHLHIKVRHPDCAEMTSQIYFRGGQYVENDVAKAVREGLIATLERRDGAEAMATRSLSRPYYEVQYDFALTRQV